MGLPGRSPGRCGRTGQAPRHANTQLSDPRWPPHGRRPRSLRPGPHSAHPAARLPGSAGHVPSDPGARRAPSAGPQSRGGPHLHPSSFSGRRLSAASLRWVRNATRRAAAGANQSAGGAGSARGSAPAAILAYGGSRHEGLNPRAQLCDGLRRSFRGPQQRPPGVAEAGAGGQRGLGASASALRKPGLAGAAILPYGRARRAMSPYGAATPGAPAHPRRREPRAAPRRVPETSGEPRADGRRPVGGRRHLVVRRRGGRLPRPAAVSLRASPRGGPAPGSARRGEGRSLAASRRPRPEMVICCAAANCSNRQGKGEKRAVSFHR